MSVLIRLLLQAIAAFEPRTVSDRAASVIARAILRADEQGTLGHLTVAVAAGCRSQIAVLKAEQGPAAPLTVQ